MAVGPKRPRDPNQMAKQLIDIVSGEVEDTLSASKKEAAKAGRVKGAKGGRVRAKRLTKEQRTDIARIAAEARWKKG